MSAFFAAFFVWLSTLFLFGSFGFWALLAGVALVLLVAETNEHGGFAFFATAAFVGALQFMSDVQPIGWAFAHPAHVAGGLLLYAAIGAGWGRFKWILKCRRYYADNPRAREPLQIRDNKEWFIERAAFWPFGVFWAITGDAFYNGWNAIYLYMAKALQADSDRIFNDAVKQKGGGK